MPSPKSGTAGSLVKPTAPTDPTDAVDSTGGSTQDVSNSGSKSGSAPSSVLVGAMGAGSSSSSSDAAANAAADGPPAPEHKPADNPDKTSWIELQLVYESNGLPVPGVYYEVILPDGTTVASGSTDEKGVGRVECIDPGSCDISFTDLDKDAWADA